MTAKTVMILGSMSSAGKSLLVTGLCRLYARRGWRVTPFKAQNMSNNAAVCSGGEIGRAQAVQAHAAGIDPTVDMNPVLLKPEADSFSQVVVHGQVWDTFSARDYYSQRNTLWQAVTESLDTLKGKFDLIIMEGAGSPAELNLQKNDIVNLAAARYARAPCLLVGDVDRGGIFAQLLGTLWVLQEEDRQMIRAFIINKFRGDPTLFTDGIQILEQRGKVPVLGMVPYLKDHGIAEEDAATIGENPSYKQGTLDVVVIHLPHISNFDDFDSLRFEPGLHLRFVHRLDHLGQPDVVLLPGTKNTLGDLKWLYDSGLAQAITGLSTAGLPVVGLCGGFQMLGKEIVDEQGIESGLHKLPGLGLLPVQTRFGWQKTVTRSKARIQAEHGFFKEIQGEIVEGYEIHMGQSEGSLPLFEITARDGLSIIAAADGACSLNAKVWGTYLHGILDNDNFRCAWLKSLGINPTVTSFTQMRAKAYDNLADTLESALDIHRLDGIITAGF
jgi:adenosylcobyric acid synthase